MKKGTITLLLFLLSTTLTFGQKLSKGMYAKMKTEKGDILLELEYKKTPLTVANFVALAEGDLKYDTLKIKEPYYDSITFHRVIKDFMIQTGDPSGSGNGNPGYAFYDEFHESLKHDSAGILSMANAGPNTNGSQFFITHKATPWLDNKHSVFGHVIDGQDVVDKIQQGDMLYGIEIIRKGWKPTFFNASKVFNKEMEAREKELENIEKAKKEKFEKMMSEKYPDAKKTESGLMYVIKEQGDGEQAVSGKTVKVHYKGTLTDGTKFDSSYDRNQPISFPLGTGRVIKGWDEGIALLKEGGKATLIIPPNLGYGSMQKGPIPANSTLIFDVELIEVN